MGQDLNTLALAHRFIREHVKSGDFCIDATAGRGGDTVFLCSLVGTTGTVIAMDIQQEALDSTEALLTQSGYAAKLVLDSHSNIQNYAQPGTVSCITFNFGWLPGGNHQIMTQPETSTQAIQNGLELLKPGGIMSLCIYYGRDSGFRERDELLKFLPTLDSKRYTVLITTFANRPNNPPIPVFIIKD